MGTEGTESEPTVTMGPEGPKGGDQTRRPAGGDGTLQDD